MLVRFYAIIYIRAAIKNDCFFSNSSRYDFYYVQGFHSLSLVTAQPIPRGRTSKHPNTPRRGELEKQKNGTARNLQFRLIFNRFVN